MMLSKVVTLASLLAPAVAQQSPRCGVEGPTEQQRASSRALLETARSGSSLQSSPLNETTIIQIYFHVVYANETEEGGYITPGALRDQLDVINKHFDPHGFHFEHKETLYHENEDWATEQDWDIWHEEIRAQTHKGGFNDLNIWFGADYGGSITGFCSFPKPNPSEEDISQDGCNVLASTIPGGSFPDYDEGLMAVHEIGHWFDLLHTFAGQSCDGEGDGIDDTPQEVVALVGGCPIGRDSCPDHPGLDPIHNHMDYTDDTCRYEFTPGQEEHMRAAWETWRAPA